MLFINRYQKFLRSIFLLVLILFVFGCNKKSIKNNYDSFELYEYVYHQIDDYIKSYYYSLPIELLEDSVYGYIEYFKKCNYSFIKNKKYLHKSKDEKIVYLTFDDGPIFQYTAQILDILKEYNIKATFFVGNIRYNALTKKIFDEGHTVALHTATHIYDYVYKDLYHFLKDLYNVQKFVYDNTGVYSHYYRFPGGSNTSKENNATKYELLKQIIPLLDDIGFEYYDWNITTGDSNPYVKSQNIIDIVNSHLSIESDRYIVLFHGIFPNTIDALPEVIHSITKRGYTFAKITDETIPMHFSR